MLLQLLISVHAFILLFLFLFWKYVEICDIIATEMTIIVNTVMQGEWNMENILLEFRGHYKVKLPILYHDNYDWLVRVYDNRVVIIRNGVLRPGLQENTTIFFDDVASIKYGQNNGRCGIQFIIPSLQGTPDPVVMTHKVGKNNAVSFSAFNESIMLTPDNISYYLEDKGDKLKEYYNQILDIYTQYRNEKSKTKSEAAVLQESILDKLKKLKELYDLGVLTDAEYAEKREKMIKEL